MFEWLFNFYFWLVYLVVTLLVGTVLLRFIAPNALKFIKTGETWRGIDGWANPVENGAAEAFCQVFAIFLFWPVIVAAILIYIILRFKIHLIGMVFKKAIVEADKIIP